MWVQGQKWFPFVMNLKLKQAKSGEGIVCSTISKLKASAQHRGKMYLEVLCHVDMT